MSNQTSGCHRVVIRRAGFMGSIVAETVKVIAIKNKRVTIQPLTTPVLSEGCGSCKLCATDTKKNVTFPVRFSSEPDFKVNEIISIERFSPNELIASILSFGMPLLVVVAIQVGAFLLGLNGETPLVVLITAIGFFAGFLMGPLVEAIFFRRFPARRIAGQ